MTFTSSTSQPMDHDRYGWRQEGKDLLRGIAAGSIVGMPLLYTMEMWWHGLMVSERHLLILLGVTLAINYVFSLFSGFREEFGFAEAASQSVSAVALGLVFSLAVLWLIHEVDFSMRWTDIIGRTLIEAAPVSLGITFANAQLRGKSRSGNPGEGGGGEGGGGGGGAQGGHRKPDGKQLAPESLQLRQDLTDVAATLGGATLFAYNVAPTEEVLVIAQRTPAWQHLLIVAASLLLCYAILFAANFRQRTVYVPSVFQSPWAETTMAYALSLLVSFLLLYLIGVPQALGSFALGVKCVVSLGLLAVIGASAGRLIT